jgi:hypothetical protein
MTAESVMQKKIYCRKMVRSRGLEPPRLAALAPQASASASSATTAPCCQLLTDTLSTFPASATVLRLISRRA